MNGAELYGWRGSRCGQVRCATEWSRTDDKHNALPGACLGPSSSIEVRVGVARCAMMRAGRTDRAARRQTRLSATRHRLEALAPSSPKPAALCLTPCLLHHQHAVRGLCVRRLLSCEESSRAVKSATRGPSHVQSRLCLRCARHRARAPTFHPTPPTPCPTRRTPLRRPPPTPPRHPSCSTPPATPGFGCTRLWTASAVARPCCSTRRCARQQWPPTQQRRAHAGARAERAAVPFVRLLDAAVEHPALALPQDAQGRRGGRG